METPKVGVQDYIVKLSKGGLGAVPFIGGLLGELLEIVVVPQHQKKLTEWCEYVNNTLEELISNHTIKKEDIFTDEAFTCIFQRTSRSYMANVEAQKVPLFKAYLKSSITKFLPFDKKLIFLNVLDVLTESQLMILRDIYENENSATPLFQNALERELAEKYCNGERNYLQLLIKGLTDSHLLNFRSAGIVVENVNQWILETSAIGREFFEYLNE